MVVGVPGSEDWAEGRRRRRSSRRGQVGDEDVGRGAHARRTGDRDEHEPVAEHAERQHDHVDDDDERGEPRTPQRLEPVSYTHLTLPTIYSV